MSRNNVLARGVVLLASAVALAGCAPGSAETAQTSDAADVAEVAAGDELEVWYLTGAEDIVNDAVARFEADNPDVTVNAVAYPNDDFKTKFAVGFGTPSGPDVFHTWGGGEFQTFVDGGQVVDLTDFVEENNLEESMGEGPLGAGKINDKQYAVPTIFDMSMVWYNKQIFADLGLTPPTTWDEFLAVITATKDAGLIPIAMANSTQWPGSHWWSEMVTLACGPDMIPNIAAGEEGYDFEDPCFVEAGERIQELVEAGAFNEGFNGLDYDSGESRVLFWSGQAAMNHMGGWTISSAETEAPEMLENMDFFLVPAWDGAVGTSDMLTGGIGQAWGVTKDNRNLEASLELLKYLTDAEAGQVAADIGRNPVIEGVTIENELTAKVSETLAAAPAISLWPNVFLDPETSQAMLVESQALFGLETTPEDAAASLQDVLLQVRGS